MTLRVLGVYREPEFSPGKIAADAAILDDVLAQLAASEVAVAALDAASVGDAAAADFDLVVAMCQGERALGKLAALEGTGTVVVNSPAAIRGCYRDRLGQALARAPVPTPYGVLVPTSLAALASSLEPFDFIRGVFVKRGDLHALGAGDVVRADRPEQLRDLLSGFAARGITSAYLQQAVEGGVAKFYGVSGGELFAALSDGAPLGAEVERALGQAATAAAGALGLEVWGGDAVLNDSEVTLVDFNDWPSFSAVRPAAAAAIARRCLRLLARAGRGGGYEDAS